MVFKLDGIPQISAASGPRRLFEGGAYYLFCPPVRRSSEGGAYPSKYGMLDTALAYIFMLRVCGSHLLVDLSCLRLCVC